MFTKIAVLGLGRVGHLAAELLADEGFDVAGFDAHAVADAPFPVHSVDLGDAQAMGAALAGREAVLSCLPYAFNKEVASAAHALGLHYFDLTEDVGNDEAYPRPRPLGEGDHGPAMRPRAWLRRNRRRASGSAV